MVLSGRIVTLAATLTLAVTVPVAAAVAAPIEGGQFVSFTLNKGGARTFFVDSPFGDPVPSFLPSAACAFSPDPRGASLSADVRGWEGPILEEVPQTRVVDMHATVKGTVTDTIGRVYNVTGTFWETGLTPPFDGVPFLGSGHLSIAGPGGVVSGDATFVDVSAGPPEWDFYFTSFDTCHVR